MKKKTEVIISSTIVFVLTLFSFSLVVCAQPEEEPPCLQCEEVPIPQQINYGQSTCGCQIDTPADSDLFVFNGTEGEFIRFSLSESSSILELCLNVWSPSNNNIISTCVTGNLLREITLEEQGEYLVVISESGVNETGSYIFQLDRFSSVTRCVESGVTIEDEINPKTDADAFYFNHSGAGETLIRISLSEVSSILELCLGVWSPSNIPIVENDCVTGNLLREITIDEQGEYRVVIWDSGINETGSYLIETQCIFGNCPLTCLICDVDRDGDGVCDDEDNCKNLPNGPSKGTCLTGIIDGTCNASGRECFSDADCGDMVGSCSMNQEDIDPNGIGDVCELGCLGNFDCDEDVDGTDAKMFKRNFGRSTFKNPCTNNCTPATCDEL